MAAPRLFKAQEFNFESLGIGGLDQQFDQIFRRAFASRVFPPSMVERLGIRHVKGVLLFGPPGTGEHKHLPDALRQNAKPFAFVSRLISAGALNPGGYVMIKVTPSSDPLRGWWQAGDSSIPDRPATCSLDRMVCCNAGKTLIARQIGKMLNGKEPKIVNGPEILNKYVGASEENVRNLFKVFHRHALTLGRPPHTQRCQQMWLTTTFDLLLPSLYRAACQHCRDVPSGVCRLQKAKQLQKGDASALQGVHM